MNAMEYKAKVCGFFSKGRTLEIDLVTDAISVILCSLICKEGGGEDVRVRVYKRVYMSGVFKRPAQSAEIVRRINAFFEMSSSIGEKIVQEKLGAVADAEKIQIACSFAASVFYGSTDTDVMQACCDRLCSSVGVGTVTLPLMG